ncbi:helix-turn-helix domain-containing protein [Eupransor demetentiae]|uniref:Contains XRE-family HTH domain (HipB) n=1 Tax=Eupransor demetentiae TaxID=3109584 RepID=A0ABM9N5S1_9LACO|nr:Transcriptional regulator [Lactobacillaceae bacterium LMG 33000]
MEFGSQIRQLRKNRKWTIEQLAEKCNMSINSISKIERNINKNIEVNTLMKLADVFETTPNKLLSVEEQDEKRADYDKLIHELDMMESSDRQKVLNALQTLVDLINEK